LVNNLLSAGKGAGIRICECRPYLFD